MKFNTLYDFQYTIPVLILEEQVSKQGFIIF